MSEQQADAGKLPVGSVGASPPTDPHSQPNPESRREVAIAVDLVAALFVAQSEPVAWKISDDRRTVYIGYDRDVPQPMLQTLAAELREFIQNETEVDAAMLGQGDYPLIAALLREAGR